MIREKTAIFVTLAALIFCIFGSGNGVSATGAQAPIAPVAFEGTLDCKSAILMDAQTGTVLYALNADAAYPPASVTKVMTLLLVMEALDAGQITLEEMVTVSAKAASMGGSQVFLEEGEQMSVEEMVKCVVISSANDAAVALAEHVAGSEESFVAKMNRRAAELGLANTHFENTNGLDDTVTQHVTSAKDIAWMSAELIKHPTILKYSGIWMDSIRDGAFGLTNTNRLVRFYPGCTGLKTGSTAKAGFCVSATAEREGLSLICVIMGASSRDGRNASAAKLLDFGFANYSLYRWEQAEEQVALAGGVMPKIGAVSADFAVLVPKGSAARVVTRKEIVASLSAPIEKGAQIGSMIFSLDGTEIGRVPIVSLQDCKKMRVFDMLSRLFLQLIV